MSQLQEELNQSATSLPDARRENQWNGANDDTDVDGTFVAADTVYIY